MPTEITAQQETVVNPALLPGVSVALAVTEITSAMNGGGSTVRNVARFVTLNCTLVIKTENIDSAISRVFAEISNTANNNLNPASITPPGNFSQPIDNPDISCSVSVNKQFSEPTVKLDLNIAQLKIELLSQTLDDLKMYILATIQNDLNP